MPHWSMVRISNRSAWDSTILIHITKPNTFYEVGKTNFENQGNYLQDKNGNKKLVMINNSSLQAKNSSGWHHTPDFSLFFSDPTIISLS